MSKNNRDLKINIDVVSPQNIMVILKGRLDVTVAEYFEESVSAHIGDQTIITLDMSQVDYVSSAGMRSIVTLLKKAHRTHGQLRIANPSDYVSNILDMMGLGGTDNDDILPISNA